jgi:hypothetical protein
MNKFQKTAAGTFEVSNRKTKLGLAALTVLMMVDGRLSEADIEKNIGSIGDAASALRQLERAGYIERARARAPEPADSFDGLFGDSADAVQLVRGALEGAIGQSADRFMLKIETASDPATFGRAIQMALSAFEAARGTRAGTALAQKLQALMVVEVLA